MCKQLNKPLLKSSKSKRSRQNRKKKLVNLGAEQNFNFSLRSDPDRNFYLYFRMDRAEIADMRAGPGRGLKNPTHTDRYDVLVSILRTVRNVNVY